MTTIGRHNTRELIDAVDTAFDDLCSLTVAIADLASEGCEVGRAINLAGAVAGTLKRMEMRLAAIEAAQAADARQQAATAGDRLHDELIELCTERLGEASPSPSPHPVFQTPLGRAVASLIEANREASKGCTQKEWDARRALAVDLAQAVLELDSTTGCFTGKE